MNSILVMSQKTNLYPFIINDKHTYFDTAKNCLPSAIKEHKFVLVNYLRLQCTVFKINGFARNTVGHNNQMIAVKSSISGLIWALGS